MYVLFEKELLWFGCLILDKMITERILWICVYELEESMKSEL